MPTRINVVKENGLPGRGKLVPAQRKKATKNITGRKAKILKNSHRQISGTKLKNVCKGKSSSANTIEI